MFRYRLTFHASKENLHDRDVPPPSDGEWEPIKMGAVPIGQRDGTVGERSREWNDETVWILWREVPESSSAYSWQFDTVTKVATFRGPGIRDQNSITLPTSNEAETVCRWLNRAISAGKEARSSEIRGLLGSR